MKYKLLKDLPFAKAGEEIGIGEYSSMDRGWWIHYGAKGAFLWLVFWDDPRDSEWFEEMGEKSWRPEIGETYWRVDSALSVLEHIYNNTVKDVDDFESFPTFRTETLANLYKYKLKAALEEVESLRYDKRS